MSEPGPVDQIVIPTMPPDTFTPVTSTTNREWLRSRPHRPGENGLDRTQLHFEREAKNLPAWTRGECTCYPK